MSHAGYMMGHSNENQAESLNKMLLSARSRPLLYNAVLSELETISHHHNKIRAVIDSEDGTSNARARLCPHTREDLGHIIAQSGNIRVIWASCNSARDKSSDMTKVSAGATVLQGCRSVCWHSCSMLSPARNAPARNAQEYNIVLVANPHSRDETTCTCGMMNITDLLCKQVCKAASVLHLNVYELQALRFPHTTFGAWRSSGSFLARSCLTVQH